MENFDDDATFICSESNALLPIQAPWTPDRNNAPWTPEQQCDSVDRIGKYIFGKMDWEQKGHVDKTNFGMYCKRAGVSEFHTVWCKIQNTGVGYLSREKWLNFFNAAGTHERILENAIHKLTVFALESEDYTAVSTCEGYAATGTSSASSSPYALSRAVARKRRISQEKTSIYQASKKMKLCNMRNSTYEGREVILLKKNEGEGSWKCYLVDFDEVMDIKTRNIVPLADESSSFHTFNDDLSREITPGETVPNVGRQRKYSNEPSWSDARIVQCADAFSPFPPQDAVSPESAQEEPISNLYVLQCLHLGIGGDEIEDFEEGDEWVGLNGACAICFAQQSLSIRSRASFRRSLSAHFRSCSGFYH